jgi:lysophospholipase L1-like esterase
LFFAVPLPEFPLRTVKKFLTLLLLALACSLLRAGEARVAFLGDSITYDGRWATLVESALRNTPSFAEAEIVNLGLPSETVSGLSEKGHADGRFSRPCLDERLDRVLNGFKPTLVFACYGMNDGIYLPLDEDRFSAFKHGILRLKTTVEKSGARILFITPPLYKTDNPSEDANRYDAVLDAYGKWLVSCRTEGWEVVDIRPDLKTAAAKARATDAAFVFAGDGVHPGRAGHRFIAESVCRQVWPLWNEEGPLRFAEGPALEILSRRSELLKLAWLTRTGHKRPEIPVGQPLDEANAKAARLLKQYRDAAKAKGS